MLGVRVGLGVALFVTVGDNELVEVKVGLFVAVLVGVKVGVKVEVGVGVKKNVFVGVGVGVPPGVGRVLARMNTSGAVQLMASSLEP